MYKIVMVRHGQSIFNKHNLFCGWVDTGLTPQGRQEAKEAGQILKAKKYQFDLVITSILNRSWQTLNLILKELKIKKIPIIRDWRLNERHYGDLQGRHKDEILKKFGEKKFWLWRRSYNTRPPKITSTNPYYQSQFNTKFKDLRVPHSECLADVYKRVVPMWQKEIIPEIKAGKNILIVGHGNSMRALIKYLDKISDKKIADLNLPTGIPLVYELDKNFKPTRHYFLGDPKKVAAKIQNIIDQGHHDQI